MEITLRGLNLGDFGLPMSALLDGPEYENVWHQCPALAYRPQPRHFGDATVTETVTSASTESGGDHWTGTGRHHI